MLKKNWISNFKKNVRLKSHWTKWDILIKKFTTNKKIRFIYVFHKYDYVLLKKLYLWKTYFVYVLLLHKAAVQFKKSYFCIYNCMKKSKKILTPQLMDLDTDQTCGKVHLISHTEQWLGRREPNTNRHSPKIHSTEIQGIIN